MGWGLAAEVEDSGWVAAVDLTEVVGLQLQ